MRPGLFRMENMEDTTFLPEKEIYQRTKQWLAMTPFVFNTIRYPLEDVQKDTCHRFSALGILEENARLWNIQADQYVTYYPPRLCVIQTIGGEGFDTMLPLSRRIGKAMSFFGGKGAFPYRRYHYPHGLCAKKRLRLLLLPNGLVPHRLKPYNPRRVPGPVCIFRLDNYLI